MVKGESSMRRQNDKLNSILKFVEQLPENQVASIIDELYAKLTVCEEQADTSVYTLHKEKVAVCRNCGSIHIVKNGKDRHGHARYICRDCGKTFGDMTNTVVSGTHKSSATWKTYIRALLDGCTLEECAIQCCISVPTAFVWRHKILNALNENSFNHVFNGMVEMDEAWVRISYKGNHSKSKDFVMPRKAYKRGTDNREQSNNARVCVLCVVERNKSYSAIIPCRGLLNSKLLDTILEEKLSEDCIVMTDGLRAYDYYFKGTNIEHVILPANRGTQKPTIKGAYHLNNVNALHSRFKLFLRKYNGVSTKYLNNYLAFFLWLENNRHVQKYDLICEKMSKKGSYITATQLRQFAPAPELAPAA